MQDKIPHENCQCICCGQYRSKRITVGCLAKPQLFKPGSSNSGLVTTWLVDELCYWRYRDLSVNDFVIVVRDLTRNDISYRENSVVVKQMNELYKEYCMMKSDLVLIAEGK